MKDSGSLIVHSRIVANTCQVPVSITRDLSGIGALVGFIVFSRRLSSKGYVPSELRWSSLRRRVDTRVVRAGMCAWRFLHSFRHLDGNYGVCLINGT
jgi:hypothetical protein